ncbi:MAG: TonB-dependent receptor [Bacteroidota bacterium]
MKSIFSWFLMACLLIPVSVWAQTGVIKGRVTDQLNNQGIGFAKVLLKGTPLGTNTDENGDYALTNLKPDLYTIEVSFLGYQTRTEYEIQVTNNKPVLLDFQLAIAELSAETVTIQASPFAKTEESPVSLRSIGAAEIMRNPGGNRDISLVVQTLPGVTSSSSFRNDLIIRGGAPNENRFYLDEVEVPNINHFATQGSSGGPVGMINVNFIKEVDFLSGAFPANRGNTLSSVFGFKLKEGRDDRLGGSFTIGSSDLNVTLEGPIGENTTFIASARQSYLGFLFQLLELPILPTYNDFQVKVKTKLSEKSQLSFIGLGAIDQFQLNLESNDTEEQQFLLASLPISPQWNYTNGLVYKHFLRKGFLTVVASRNMLNNRSFKYQDNDDSSEDNLILDYRSQEIENKGRIEHTFLEKGFRINYGVNYEYAKYNNSTFNRIFTPQGPLTVDFESAFNMQKYGFFAQASKKYLDNRLILSAGVRIDGNDYSEEMQNPLDQFSPRVSAAFALTEKFILNFNVGRYFQLPAYTLMGYEEDGRLVNRDNGLTYIANNQLVAGLEWNTASLSKITVEGYYKAYENYPFLLRDSLTLANLGADFGIIGNEPAVSTAGGRSYGLEFLFQQRLYRGFYGIASYTLGWSEFEDKNGELVPSSWDARHIANFTIGKKFEKGFLKDVEIGLAWRYQSGLPLTPFSADSDLVLNWDVRGTATRDFNQLNTLRGDAVNALDIRIDKKWFFQRWSLNLYIDVQNVTGNVVNDPTLILDRPLDADNRPIGGGVVVNPTAPLSEQRYALKSLAPATGTPLPTLGLVVEF